MEPKENQLLKGGTGKRLGNATVTVAGVAALIATLLTAVAMWLQLKNYRKPLLQRYVVRILLMVPFFSAASWASLMSIKASSWIEPFRDVYEAFVIYAFFQLLINFIGGERALIILMHGRPPVAHPWPLNHFFSKIDISDPHTFLAIKRGILQYTWIKPMLAIAAIIMKATDTYQQGYIGLKSGYFWSGLIYNISITISLYALAMFWICMSADLQPFRPVPKFLCIKGIIFASYWQGFMLSVLVWLGAIPDDVPGYTPDNLAASIQDALICFEMPIFSLLHWYAFSWRDYADVTISAARMPMKYSFRDAFGIVDLVQDAKDTFGGKHYEYRYFDAGDDVLPNEESQQRAKRIKDGMRYERGGKGKYWIPKPGTDSKSPLLGESSQGRSRSTSETDRNKSFSYGATADGDVALDDDDEQLFVKARALEFGDWNYPVITAHRATREDRLYSSPEILTASSNRHLIQPTKRNRKQRKQRIKQIQEESNNPPNEDDEDQGEASSRISRTFERTFGSQASNENKKSDPSQLVDIVVEDEQAEEAERVRARKEGSPEWNKSDSKHFVRALPDADPVEEVHEGFEQPQVPNRRADQLHTLDTSFDITSSREESAESSPGEGQAQWHKREFNNDEDMGTESQSHGLGEEADVWADEAARR